VYDGVVYDGVVYDGVLKINSVNRMVKCTT
jgi:hypothetical protein